MEYISDRLFPQNKCMKILVGDTGDIICTYIHETQY